MALREEFEFLAFRCCFCFAFNPARRQRPTAPGLPVVVPGDRSASVMELPTEDDALTYASRERSFSENDLTADADLPPKDQRALGGGSRNGRDILRIDEAVVVFAFGERAFCASIYWAP